MEGSSRARSREMPCLLFVGKGYDVTVSHDLKLMSLLGHFQVQSRWSHLEVFQRMAMYVCGQGLPPLPPITAHS